MKINQNAEMDAIRFHGVVITSMEVMGYPSGSTVSKSLLSKVVKTTVGSYDSGRMTEYLMESLSSEYNLI